MPNYGSKLTSAIYIRGIGARSSGQSIGLYVDNVPYLDKSAFDFEFNDIQRIEVMRGPQGTLYGRNAMGGIVNIYTLSPFDYQGTKILLSGGSYGDFKAKLSTFQKLSDNFAISASGYYDRNDGFFTNEYTGKKADDEQSAGGRLKLDWRNGKGLKAQYSATYDYVKQNAFPYGKYDDETNSVQPIRINDPSSYWRRLFNNSLYLEWANEKFILSSTTSYQYLRDDMKMDQDYSEKSIFTLNQIQKQHGWTEEIAIRSNTKSNYQWSFGGYGFYNSLKTDGPVIFKEDGISGILQSAFDNLLKDNSRAPKLTVKGDENNQIYFPGVFDTPTHGFAAFHQSTYNNLFADGLSVTAGIRLDYEKDKMTYDSSVEDMTIGVQMGQYMNMDVPVTTRLNGSISQDYLQVLPKVSVRYQCDPSTFTYFSVAKGYKSGGYNVQMFGDLVQAQAKYDLMSKYVPSVASEPVAVEEAAAYKPEFSWDYELGIRSELIKNRLTAELTLFYMDIKDIQLTTFAETGSGRMITNGGKAKSAGVEAGMRALLTKGLTLDLNYGFTMAKFKDYQVKSSATDSVNYKNNYVPYTPRHTFSAALQYTKLFRNSFVDQFTASAQFTGVGRIYWTEKNDIEQPFYGVVNAKVGVRKGIAQVNLWAKNITNTNYQEFYFESYNNAFIQKGRPFQIGAELSLSF
jgi:outer membrane receptor protein involved in Fe transport